MLSNAHSRMDWIIAAFACCTAAGCEPAADPGPLDNNYMACRNTINQAIFKVQMAGDAISTNKSKAAKRELASLASELDKEYGLPPNPLYEIESLLSPSQNITVVPDQAHIERFKDEAIQTWEQELDGARTCAATLLK
ncbi:hypothetical protein [Hyphomonas jannaschiana]|nr:hypothetical protein [Hyphomonas jannaschiana]